MSTTRIQLALNVDDVTVATAFYEKMFGVPPHKVRDGYANFAIEDPPLKLVLIEKPGANEHLNHLGVEAADAEDVVTALQRFQAAGLETEVAEQDVCCHATQDKVFVTAPTCHSDGGSSTWSPTTILPIRMPRQRRRAP